MAILDSRADSPIGRFQGLPAGRHTKTSAVFSRFDGSGSPNPFHHLRLEKAVEVQVLHGSAAFFDRAGGTLSIEVTLRQSLAAHRSFDCYQMIAIFCCSLSIAWRQTRAAVHSSSGLFTKAILPYECRLASNLWGRWSGRPRRRTAAQTDGIPWEMHYHRRLAFYLSVASRVNLCWCTRLAAMKVWRG